MIHETAPLLWISQLSSGLAADSGLVSPLQPLYIPVIKNKLSVSWGKEMYHLVIRTVFEAYYFMSSTFNHFMLQYMYRVLLTFSDKEQLVFTGG